MMQLDSDIQEIRDRDPYWGLDLDLARRMAALLALISVAFAVVLWPLSPLSDMIGNDGWLIGIGLVAFGLATAALLVLRPSLWTFNRLAIVAFASIPAISVAQWLAGGAGQPYEITIFIPLLFVAAIYSRLVIGSFLVLAGASLAAPLCYDEVSGDLAASALGPFLLLIGIAYAIHYLMLRVRTAALAMELDEEHAREEARVDRLTGIGNRRSFEEALLDEISRANRMETPLSMAMGDVERFKQINDLFGHLEGDKALRAIATELGTELRLPDRAFRWGGDEFVLLLPGADREGAEAVIGRVRSRIAAACRRPDGEPVSIHFASAQLESGMAPQDLCEAADLALMAERARTGRARA